MEKQTNPVLLPAGKSFVQKPIFWLVLVLVFLIIGFGIYFYYFPSRSDLEIQNDLIARQLAELEREKQKVGYQPPNEGQIKEQLKQLENLKKESNYQPPSEETIKKQLEELEKLKNQ